LVAPIYFVEGSLNKIIRAHENNFRKFKNIDLTLKELIIYFVCEMILVMPRGRGE